MSDLNNMMEEDSVTVPTEKELDKLQTLIGEQINLELSVETLSIKLAELQSKLRDVSEVKIPDLFKILHLSELKLEDGSMVKCAPFYSASIGEENEVACFKWLRDHNLDDLIKHEIKAVFGKGEDEQCSELKKVLDELHLNYMDKQGVHPQTLKALVREQIENEGVKIAEQGEAGVFPRELFKVFVGAKTKITKPKAKRR